MLSALVNEQGQHVTLWHDYLSVLTDPAHILVEVTVSVAFILLELLFVGLLWKRVMKPRLTRDIHEEVDAEHGVVHKEPYKEPQAPYRGQKMPPHAKPPVLSPPTARVRWTIRMAEALVKADPDRGE